MAEKEIQESRTNEKSPNLQSFGGGLHEAYEYESYKTMVNAFARTEKDPEKQKIFRETFDYLKQINQEKERIDKEQKSHLAATEELKRFYNKPENYTVENQAKLSEKYALSNVNLVNALEEIVNIQDEFVKKGEPTNERLEVFRAVMDFKIKPPEIITFTPKPTPQNLPIPASIEEYNALKQRTDDALLFARRNVYTGTGNAKYKKYFDGSQQKLLGRLVKDSNEIIDDAEKRDRKKRSLMETNPAVADTAKAYAASFAGQLDFMHKLQTENPLEAYSKCNGFIENLDYWNEVLAGNVEPKEMPSHLLNPLRASLPGKMQHSEFITALKTHPSMHQDFSKIVNTYYEQAIALRGDVLMRNPVISEFNDNLVLLIRETQPFLQSIQRLVEMAQKGEAPSRDFMERWIYPNAEKVKANPRIEKLLNSKAVQLFLDFTQRHGDPNHLSFIKQSQFKNLDDETLSAVNLLQGNIFRARDYCKTLKETAKEALKIKGERSDVKGFFTDAFIFVAKTYIAVTVAVAATALCPPSGAVSLAVITGFGAATGSAIGEAAFEKNYTGFNPKVFIVNWATGAAFTFGAGVTGNIFGTAIGKVAAGATKREGSAIARSAQKYAEKYAARLLQKMPASSTKEIGFKHILKEIAEETREELLEDTLQRVGQGVAPDHPWLGFALSLIPSTSKKARSTFLARTGKFSPSAGIDGEVTDNGVELQYDNSKRTKVENFLRQRNAPAEVMQTFEQNGYIDLTQNGINIKITPKNSADQTLAERAALAAEYRKILEENPQNGILFSALEQPIKEGKISPDQLRQLSDAFFKQELSPEQLAQKTAEILNWNISKARQFLPLVMGGMLTPKLGFLDRLLGNSYDIDHPRKITSEETLRSGHPEILSIEDGLVLDINGFAVLCYETKKGLVIDFEHITGKPGGMILEPGESVDLNGKFLSNVGGPQFRNLPDNHLKIEYLGDKKIKVTKLSQGNSEKLDIAVRDRLNHYGVIGKKLSPFKKYIYENTASLKIYIDRRYSLQLRRDQNGDLLIKTENNQSLRIRPGEKFLSDGKTVKILERTETSGIKEPIFEIENLGNGKITLTDRATENGTIVETDFLLEKYQGHRPQFKETETLFKNNMFKPRETIREGGYTFFMGQIMKNQEGYLYCVMMVDIGDGLLLPRIAYKSQSQGAWRISPGSKLEKKAIARLSQDPNYQPTENDFTYSKGNGISYTQETKPTQQIEQYLERAETDNPIEPMQFSAVHVYFSIGDGRPTPINTYPTEGIKAFRDGTDPSTDSLAKYGFKLQDYQPGLLENPIDSSYLTNLQYPPGFVPNFRKGPYAVLNKNHTLLGPYKVEMYSSYLDGEQIDMGIAYDRYGRVWIDSIQLRNSPVTSYGTRAIVINSGLLTHKPLEYASQAVGLNSSQKSSFNERYVDITPLLDNLKIIQQFRIDRGIYRRR